MLDLKASMQPNCRNVKFRMHKRLKFRYSEKASSIKLYVEDGRTISDLLRITYLYLFVFWTE